VGAGRAGLLPPKAIWMSDSEPCSSLSGVDTQEAPKRVRVER
jgi:hypothetical protein